jgi:hypothetical protein
MKALLLAMMITAPGIAAEPGTYALTINAATRAKIPFFGWTRSDTRSIVMATLERTETGTRQTHKVCDISIRTRGIPVKTIIPDAFVNALPIKNYAIDLDEKEGTLRYRANMGVDNVGMKPTADVVPRTPDDPNVVDMEGDGFPGATVLVDVPMFSQAKLYVSQRGSMQLDGAVQPDGSVSGTVTVGPTVQHTLAASNILFKSSPPIKPEPERSWFRLVPISGEPTCENTLKRAATER